MNQEERLAYLVEKFKEDSIKYREMALPRDEMEGRTALRSFMNIRMPRKMNPEVLQVQDEYLQERAREKGVVALSDIQAISESLNSSHRHKDKLSVWQGDITRLEVGAIVNAANSQMLGCFVPMHTCIDNCIHTFAGIQLRYACSQYMAEMKKRHGQDYEEPVGQAFLTSGYNLPAEYVIHTVGPIVDGPLRAGHRDALRRCYQNIMECARENNVRSIAFCCISTGVFRFPNDEAARVAVDAVSGFLDYHGSAFDRVIFNVFKDTDKEIYEGLLR